MGLIRKTLSVSTLGVVSFRSKKERLRRAERSQRDAEASLHSEHAARVAAEGRITRAEKRVKQASAEAEPAAKRLEQSEHRRPRRHSGQTMGEEVARLPPIGRARVASAP